MAQTSRTPQHLQRLSAALGQFDKRLASAQTDVAVTMQELLDEGHILRVDRVGGEYRVESSNPLIWGIGGDLAEAFADLKRQLA